MRAAPDVPGATKRRGLLIRTVVASAAAAAFLLMGAVVALDQYAALRHLEDIAAMPSVSAKMEERYKANPKLRELVSNPVYKGAEFRALGRAHEQYQERFQIPGNLDSSTGIAHEIWIPVLSQRAKAASNRIVDAEQSHALTWATALSLTYTRLECSKDPDEHAEWVPWEASAADAMYGYDLVIEAQNNAVRAGIDAGKKQLCP